MQHRHMLFIVLFLILTSACQQNAYVLDTELLPPNPLAAKRGYTVALDHDKVAITTDQPRGVEIYQLQNGNWTYVQTLSPRASASSSARFGQGLALQGNTLAVGAPINTTTNMLASDYGYIDIFQWNDMSGFTHTQTLTSSIPANDGNSHNFASVLALHNDILAAGDPFAIERSGQVFVYQRDANGFAPFGNPITDISNGTTDAHFGHSLAINDTMLAIGDPGRTTTNAREGRVHIYERSANGYIPKEILNSPNSGAPASPKEFGTSLSMNNEELLITQQGHVFYYHIESNSHWAFLREITAEVGSRSFRRQTVALGDGEFAIGQYLFAERNGMVNVASIDLTPPDYNFQPHSLHFDPEGTVREFGSQVDFSGTYLLISTGGHGISTDSDDGIYIFKRRQP